MVRRTGAHLDPSAIAAYNAKSLALAKRALGENFLGPQMTWHRKPNAGGGPCDICGCPGLRLGVRHRALEALHDMPGAVYVKTHNDASGGGAVETYLDAEGKPPRRRHVGPGEPPPSGAKLRHVGPHDVPPIPPRERLMLEALGHVVETVRRDEGNPDPAEAVGAIVEILDNHGIAAGDVERAIESGTHTPHVHLMLLALMHISRAVRGSGDPYDALSAVIATLCNYGVAVGDVDKVLR